MYVHPIPSWKWTEGMTFGKCILEEFASASLWGMWWLLDKILSWLRWNCHKIGWFLLVVVEHGIYLVCTVTILWSCVSFWICLVIMSSHPIPHTALFFFVLFWHSQSLRWSQSKKRKIWKFTWSLTTHFLIILGSSKFQILVGYSLWLLVYIGKEFWGANSTW